MYVCSESPSQGIASQLEIVENGPIMTRNQVVTSRSRDEGLTGPNYKLSQCVALNVEACAATSERGRGKGQRKSD